MGIWYQNDAGVFNYTDVPELIKFYECMQELQLFKGEASFYFNNGIDYQGIINKRVFINKEFNDVIDKYKPYFLDIQPDFIINDSKTKLNIKINFMFNDGKIKDYILSLDL